MSCWLESTDGLEARAIPEGDAPLFPTEAERGTITVPIEAVYVDAATHFPADRFDEMARWVLSGDIRHRASERSCTSVFVGPIERRRVQGTDPETGMPFEWERAQCYVAYVPGEG